jgi:hypothetical protein
MFNINKVRDLFKTEPNTAYFWSGLGENGSEIAEEINETAKPERIKELKIYSLLMSVIIGITTVAYIIRCFTDDPVSIFTYVMTEFYTLYLIIIIGIILYGRYKRKKSIKIQEYNNHYLKKQLLYSRFLIS